MRSQPRQARMAVATLYIRLRDARRHRERLLASMGPESVAYIAADSAHTAIWNALQGMHGHMTDPVAFPSPREMMALVARRGAALARNDQRQKAA